MCGIFAYGGNHNAAERIVNGLRRLEYRGYDSWGLAVNNTTGIWQYRQVGSVKTSEINMLLADAGFGIGHTRWATHGGVSEQNAHPHLSNNGDFALVHNGIVENYQLLKTSLQQRGHIFSTTTDTEVIVRLLEDQLQQFYHSGNRCQPEHPLRNALLQVFQELQGLNTVLLLATEEDYLLGARNGSPLVVGYAGPDIYIASDPLSFCDQTSEVSFVEDGQLVEYRARQVRYYDIASGDLVLPEVQTLQLDSTTVDSGRYPHFMLKEVLEQPQAIAAASQLPEAELQALVNDIKPDTRVITTGAGGAFYAAQQIGFFLSSIANIDAHSVAAYEFEANPTLIRPGDIVLAVSQSGETADTLDALRAARQQGARIASIVNMPGTTISRLSDIAFYNNAGPEICVLSTKSCTAQMAFGYLLAHCIKGTFAQARQHLHGLQASLKNYLNNALLELLQQLTARLQRQSHIFLLGKNAYRTSALIGALNIKEASYVHAEGFAAGELKHGVISLIDSGVPVIVFVPQEQRDKMLGATAEVKSRGAFVIGIAEQDNELFDVHIPLLSAPACQPITSLIPCQLLAYYLSVARGHNPDRPRHLAKSVTVR